MRNLPKIFLRSYENVGPEFHECVFYYLLDPSQSLDWRKT